MKKLLKILTIAGIVIVAMAVVTGTLIYFSGPEFPEDIDKIIDDVLASDIPEFIQGDTGYAASGDTQIWYECIVRNEMKKGAILLFMGISNDALGWPQGFIDELVDSGYQVIRYDYRGTGMSDWFENGSEHPYTLSDLAADAAAVLDQVGTQKVHLVGISLGGMVAQEFAINYPARSLTLTSMMSSGNIIDKSLPAISKKTTFDLIRIGLKYGLFPTEKNTIKLHVSARLILRGNADYDIDISGTAQQVLYNLRRRNGYNHQASRQHQEAVIRSGSRYDKLKEIECPALIIHGLDDPFVPIEHSQKLASILPNSTEKWFENMGHDLPPDLYKQLVHAFIENFEKNPQ